MEIFIFIMLMVKIFIFLSTSNQNIYLNNFLAPPQRQMVIPLCILNILSLMFIYVFIGHMLY